MAIFLGTQANFLIGSINLQVTILNHLVVT